MGLWTENFRIIGLLKGQCHEIFYPVFFIKQLLLLPSDLHRNGVKFFKYSRSYTFRNQLPGVFTTGESRLPGVFTSSESWLPGVVITGESSLPGCPQFCFLSCWFKIHQGVETPLQLIHWVVFTSWTVCHHKFIALTCSDAYSKYT